MSTDTKTRMTVDEFVTWCDARARQWRGSDEPGWGLFDGEPVMQASERWAHGRVKANLYDALRSAVSAAGVPYAISIDSLGIRIDERTATKPDAVVFPAGLIGSEYIPLIILGIPQGHRRHPAPGIAYGQIFQRYTGVSDNSGQIFLPGADQ